MDGDDAGGKDWRRSPWVRAAQVVFVVAVAVAFVNVVVRNAGELDDVRLQLRAGWLVLAAPVAVAAGPLLPLAWRQVVQATGHPLALRRAVRIWYLGQTGRYLPTGLIAFASRAALAAREGVPATVTVATAAVELVLLITTGAGLAAAALPSSVLAAPLRAVIVAGAVVTLAVAPLLLRTLSRRVKALDPHGAGGWQTAGVYRAEGWFAANNVAKSAAFVLFAAALLPVGRGDIWLLVGAFSGANALGQVGITPAGLGVREGALATILSARYGLGDAAAVAVASRVWDTVIEAAWLALVQLRSFRAGAGNGPTPSIP
ncbi:MAG: hypothetical protein ACT4PW_03360 [Acidimicrobiia bacterium]